MTEKTETIRTKIWQETAEEDNPFVAATCYCSGYDVYGDLLGKASWIEYLYLLFKRERPTPAQAKLLEWLAIAVANPGPRDHSVHAARRRWLICIFHLPKEKCFSCCCVCQVRQCTHKFAVEYIMRGPEKLLESENHWETHVLFIAGKLPCFIDVSEKHEGTFFQLRYATLRLRCL